MAASASVLPPPPAQRSSTCQPGCGAAQQRGHLRALVLDLDEALHVGRLGRDRGLRAVRRERSMRSPHGRIGRRDRMQMRQGALGLGPVALQQVDAEIDRRAGRQRGAFAAAASSPNTVGEGRREPFGIVAARRGPARRQGRRGEARLARRRVSGGGACSCAGEQRRDRVAIVGPELRASAPSSMRARRIRRPSAKPPKTGPAARRRRGPRWRRDPSSPRSDGCGPTP